MLDFKVSKLSIFYFGVWTHLPLSGIILTEWPPADFSSGLESALIYINSTIGAENVPLVMNFVFQLDFPLDIFRNQTNMWFSNITNLQAKKRSINVRKVFLLLVHKQSVICQILASRWFDICILSAAQPGSDDLLREKWKEPPGNFMVRTKGMVHMKIQI